MAPAPVPEASPSSSQRVLRSLNGILRSPNLFLCLATAATAIGGIFFVLGIAWIISADNDSTRTWLFFAFGVVLLVGGLTALLFIKLKSLNRRESSSRRRRRRTTRAQRPPAPARVFVDVAEAPPRSWTTSASENPFPAPPTYDEAVGHPPVFPTRSTHRASIPPPYRN